MIAGTSFDGNKAIRPSIVTDNDGVPHVAYYQELNEDTSYYYSIRHAKICS